MGERKSMSRGGGVGGVGAHLAIEVREEVGQRVELLLVAGVLHDLLQQLVDGLLRRRRGARGWVRGAVTRGGSAELPEHGAGAAGPQRGLHGRVWGWGEGGSGLGPPLPGGGRWRGRGRSTRSCGNVPARVKELGANMRDLGKA